MRSLHKDLTDPHYVAWTRFLGEAERWDKERIRDYQLSEIRRITSLAYENTAGYKKLFDSAGVHPAKISATDDLGNFPFLTKQMIRDGLEDYSVEVPNRYYVTTGGSSGVPVGMYRDPVSFAKELASKAHQYYRVGWREGDRQIVFRGLSINTADHIEFVPEFNELRCSTYDFTPEVLEQYIWKAAEYSPEWIRCYPSAGFMLATFLRDTRSTFPKIKGILCASEMLFDFQKALMQEVFDCRIFSHYGHYELAALAGFCEFTDDYHVLPEYGFVELIDDHGKPVTKAGETGEIVATSFITTATPMIRYRTGDQAILKGRECKACGRPYQVWEKVVGRRQEMIVSRCGRLISTTMLNMHDDVYDHIKQYQFFQNEAGRVSFRYVPRTSLTDEITADIRRRLLVKLGDDIELEMLNVPQIQLTKRGKHRALVQELKLAIDNHELHQAQ